MNNIEKQDQEKIPNVKIDGWNAEQLVAESTNKPADETTREVLRGDESKGDADERDIVGSVNSEDTPQGREEAKIDEKRNESPNK